MDHSPRGTTDSGQADDPDSTRAELRTARTLALTFAKQLQQTLEHPFRTFRNQMTYSILMWFGHRSPFLPAGLAARIARRAARTPMADLLRQVDTARAMPTLHLEATGRGPASAAAAPEFRPYAPPATSTSDIRLIALYLPQFHPFPENDAWWGKGFTEWTNVGKALPNFVGHYQPHCPIHFGYYDLRVPSVMEEQARVAREYGIGGFCYYFYWFGGKTLLETPLRAMLANKAVDIPFCLTWANENWSRRWDGADQDILIGQKHSPEDSQALLHHLAEYLRDPRYIRIDNKPVVIIYRANIIPDILSLTNLWRMQAREMGFDGLYLMATQTFGVVDPREMGFDAAVEFPPHGYVTANYKAATQIVNPDFQGHVHDYNEVVDRALSRPEPDFPLYRSVMLSWDNTARKQNNPEIYVNFSVQRYREWLAALCLRLRSKPGVRPEEKLIFINAWNEWAEGTHLEPDRRYGFAYLEATHQALLGNMP